MATFPVRCGYRGRHDDDLAADMLGVSRHWHKRIDREREIGGFYEELLDLVF